MYCWFLKRKKWLFRKIFNNQGNFSTVKTFKVKLIFKTNYLFEPLPSVMFFIFFTIHWFSFLYFFKQDFFVINRTFSFGNLSFTCLTVYFFSICLSFFYSHFSYLFSFPSIQLSPTNDFCLLHNHLTSLSLRLLTSSHSACPCPLTKFEPSILHLPRHSYTTTFLFFLKSLQFFFFFQNLINYFYAHNKFSINNKLELFAILNYFLLKQMLTL